MLTSKSNNVDFEKSRVCEFFRIFEFSIFIFDFVFFTFKGIRSTTHVKLKAKSDLTDKIQLTTTIAKMTGIANDWDERSFMQYSAVADGSDYTHSAAQGADIQSLLAEASAFGSDHRPQFPVGRHVSEGSTLDAQGRHKHAYPSRETVRRRDQWEVAHDGTLIDKNRVFTQPTYGDQATILAITQARRARAAARAANNRGRALHHLYSKNGYNLVGPELESLEARDAWIQRDDLDPVLYSQQAADNPEQPYYGRPGFSDFQ